MNKFILFFLALVLLALPSLAISSTAIDLNNAAIACPSTGPPSVVASDEIMNATTVVATNLARESTIAEPPMYVQIPTSSPGAAGRAVAGSRMMQAYTLVATTSDHKVATESTEIMGTQNPTDRRVETIGFKTHLKINDHGLGVTQNVEKYVARQTGIPLKCI